jgi:hypothetical protein
VGERGRLLCGRNQMRERDQRRGARIGRAQGARGVRAKLGRAGLGWATPRGKISWHAQPQIGKSIREAKFETNLINARY